MDRGTDCLRKDRFLAGLFVPLIEMIKAIQMSYYIPMPISMLIPTLKLTLIPMTKSITELMSVW